MKQKILQQVKQLKVHYIHLQFCDLLGMVKSVTIPASKLAEAIDHNVWFDGSSIKGFARIYESDMFLKLDLATFALVPWESTPGQAVARIICDVFLPDGQPFRGDPRHILARQVARVRRLGYEYHVGPELEFFLFPLDENGRPTVTPHDTAGYFDYSTDKARAIRRTMGDVVSAMDVDVETIHHEVAPGQHEIDFKHHDAITQADQVTAVKTALRAVAEQTGLHATFMPKPLAGINGSGMHVHQSLIQKGRNVFHSARPADHGLSLIARQFIAGQLRYISEIIAVTNPTVNSYRRLVPGYEAPVYITWGQTNRSAMIRIPRISAGRDNSTRCELRSPDSSSNPYLAFAVMLAAGLAGLEEKLTPPDPIEENIYLFTDKKARRRRIRTVPDSLTEALNKMERGRLAREVLGDDAFTAFLQAKRMEALNNKLSVSAWELENYLDNY